MSPRFCPLYAKSGSHLSKMGCKGICIFVQLIDYSYPIDYDKTHIYSGQIKYHVLGDPFAGVFDSLSYGFGVAAVIGMILATWLVTPDCTIAKAALRVFGSCFNQGLLNDGKLANKRLSQALVAIFILYNFMVTIMYSSVFISMLTARGSEKSIEKLTDLLKEEYQHVRYNLPKTLPK